MTRIRLAAILAALAFTLTACNLGPEQGEVSEVEQEIDTTELTVWCDGEEIDIDIPRTDRWERGDVYGCQRRPEDKLTTGD